MLYFIVNIFPLLIQNANLKIVMDSLNFNHIAYMKIILFHILLDAINGLFEPSIDILK